MIEYWASRDLENYLNCLHEDFTGWFPGDPLPVDKNTNQKFEAYMLSNVKVHLWDVQPVSITVSGDMAIVHYVLATIREDATGTKLLHSRYTDIWKKENGKWLNIGTHGVRVTE
jgi:ketosteroid isomerase-like protein